jgi:alpha/beta superfamily hydrolase
MDLMKIKLFNGIECKLKCLFYKNSDLKAPVAILLHPELKNDKEPSLLVQKTIESLIDKSFSVIFFDFERNTNIITEPILKKQEELNEVISVLSFASATFPLKNSLWLISFENTTLVTLQIVMRRPEITNYILLFPARQKDFNFIIPCQAEGLLLYLSEYESQMIEFVNRLVNKNNLKMETLSFDVKNTENRENIKKISTKFDEFLTQKLDLLRNKKKIIRRNIRKRKRKGSEKEVIKPVKQPLVMHLHFDE